MLYKYIIYAAKFSFYLYFFIFYSRIICFGNFNLFNDLLKRKKPIPVILGPGLETVYWLQHFHKMHYHRCVILEGGGTGGVQVLQRALPPCCPPPIETPMLLISTQRLLMSDDRLIICSLSSNVGHSVLHALQFRYNLYFTAI